MDDDPRITISDIRPLYCVKGVRGVFVEAGVDFGRFLREGAKASELRGHGCDAMVDRVIESMRAKETRDGNG